MSDPMALHRDPFALLYSDHHRWLQGWLRLKLGNAGDAADLAQDTFARILGRRSAEDLAAVREPRAYLTTVAKGLMVNWYRRQALERAYLDALAVLPEPEGTCPEQRLIILQTLHDIDTALDALPDRVRQAFLLSQLDGLKYDDIAVLLDVSLPSVKRYMKQAFVQCLLAMED